MTTLQLVLRRGAFALVLALAGLSVGYVGTPLLLVSETTAMRELAVLPVPIAQRPVTVMQSPRARRHASRSTRVPVGMSTWNQGDLLR